MKSSKDQAQGARPRMLLAHGDAAYAAAGSRHFRRLGWEVYLAHSAAEVRHLAGLLTPAVVVLDTEFPDESGWLTCCKLRAEHASLKVLLVTPQATAGAAGSAALVGAAGLVGQDRGVPALVDEVYGTSAAAAG